MGGIFSLCDWMLIWGWCSRFHALAVKDGFFILVTERGFLSSAWNVRTMSAVLRRGRKNARKIRNLFVRSVISNAIGRKWPSMRGR